MKNKKLTEEIIKHSFDKDFFLLKNDVSDEMINSFDKDGRTMLFHAVLAENLNMAKWLIAKGAEINAKDKIGWTPLHYAAQGYFIEILIFLISKGADVNAKDLHGNSVLSRAVFTSQGRGEVILALLNNGANPTIKNNYGVSAIDLANTIANYDIKQYFSPLA